MHRDNFHRNSAQWILCVIGLSVGSLLVEATSTTTRSSLLLPGTVHPRRYTQYNKIVPRYYGRRLASTPTVQNQETADTISSRLQRERSRFPSTCRCLGTVRDLMSEECTTSWELQGGSRRAAALAMVKKGFCCCSCIGWLDMRDRAHMYSSRLSTNVIRTNADTG
jgi:hypothetical protein